MYIETSVRWTENKCLIALYLKEEATALQALIEGEFLLAGPRKEIKKVEEIQSDQTEK